MTQSLLDLIASKRTAIAANNRAKTVKPKDGRNRVRILPRWDGDATKPFWQDFGSHYIKDAAGQFVAAYICADRTFNRPCAICEGIGQAMKATRDDGLVKLLKDANAAPRVLLNVLIVDSEKPNEPQILELAPSAFNGILGLIQEWGPDMLNMTGGRDVIIERAGTGLSTKYTVAPCAQTTNVDPGILSRAANLDDYVKQESNEGQTKALNGLRSAIGLPAPGDTSALLSAPGASTLAAVTLVAPAVAAPAAPVAHDMYATATAPAVAAPVVAQPAPVAAPVVTQPAPVVTQAPAAPNASSATGDAELDQLLASLPT